MLKQKHEAFLRRIPSPGTSPAVSTVASPINPTTPLPNSPHYYSGTLSHLPADANSILRSRRTRKISVSQNDIALLSDQNSELLSKVERLEVESMQTEQAGRRRLRNLEKVRLYVALAIYIHLKFNAFIQEIQGLKDELEKSQSRSDEFEAQAKRGFSVDAEKVVEDVWRKKLGREEKIRAIRGHFSSRDDGDIVDFAPRNPWNTPQSTKTKSLRRAPSMPLSPIPFRFPNTGSQPVGYSHQGDEDDVFSSTHAASQSHSQPPSTGRELAVVSQLLSKIQELEETNSYISEQQARSTSTLHAVQRDAESIRKVYECLGDSEDIQWEIVPDDDLEGSENGTVRFQSLRRRLDCIKEPSQDLDDFAEDIRPDMQSTANELMLAGITTHSRPRKSVVGLFDPSPEASISQLPMPFQDGSPEWDEDLNHTRSLSTISVFSSPSPGQGPTLSNELGDQWTAGTGNYHMRDTSLYNLISPTPSPASLPEQPPFHASTFAGRVKFSPPPDSASSAPRDQRDFRTARYRRMSQTVRARADQLTGGRFKETLLGPGSGASKAVTSIPQSLMGVFESMAGSSTPSSGALKKTKKAPAEAEKPPARMKREEATTSTVAVTTADDRVKSQRVSKLVLELWLWLQFGIIILVFLYMVAKRGPRNVLRDAEKKRRATTAP